jgi:hypothetical protein
MSKPIVRSKLLTVRNLKRQRRLTLEPLQDRRMLAVAVLDEYNGVAQVPVDAAHAEPATR